MQDRIGSSAGRAGRFGVQDRPAGLSGAGIGWQQSQLGWQRRSGWQVRSAGQASSAGDRPAELAAQVRFGVQDIGRLGLQLSSTHRAGSAG